MSDTFTINDILRAAEQLKKNEFPPSTDGTYAFHLSSEQMAELRIEFYPWATYRDRAQAWSLLVHERRRRQLGKRGPVTGKEIIVRVLRASSPA